MNRLARLRLVAGLVMFILPAVVSGGTRGDGDDASVDVVNSEDATSEGAPTSGGNYGVADRWVRHAVCLEDLTSTDWRSEPLYYPGETIHDCSIPVTPPMCPDGQMPLAPWWVSRVQPDGSYAPWTRASGYQCAADLIYAQVAQAWATMPITPTTYSIQPATGWAIAELGVIPIADPTPQTMDVVIIGTPVIIRAVPTSYTWSVDDGSAWTTTDPGKPYDQGGHAIGLARSEHRAAMTLTTTWRGEYSTDGGATWADAPGTATTTSGTVTFHVYNPHTHLVDCDVNGYCASGNSAPAIPKTLLDPDADGIDNYLIPDNQIDAYLDARDAGRTWTDTARKDLD